MCLRHFAAWALQKHVMASCRSTGKGKVPKASHTQKTTTEPQQTDTHKAGHRYEGGTADMVGLFWLRSCW